ncbi:MAG: UDP-N-acetylglucosamine--N-acetylmuramyl-(pentapeptide) pyrophosphoryl-undecaprenol N-acetylglucosamine transferase [Candidatus Saccharimonadales bacterium]
MTIVLTGGGSGGHITPILAVAHELKRLDPSVHLVYIGQAGDSLADITHDNSDIDVVYAISAGKLRRYHGEGIAQLLDLKTGLLNARDAFRTLRGCWQAYWLLRKLHPAVVFVKGGFVGVPVGLAAAKQGIPYVTHDSDAIPGLANRIIARWAAVHAVALPAEVYAYPRSKTRTVGVPVHANYLVVNREEQVEFKQTLGLEKFAKLLFVTGGGLGAQRLNDAVEAIVPKLLATWPDLAIVQSVGRQNEAAVSQHYRQILTAEDQGRVLVKGFVTDMHRYSGAADVIITRAGATALAEIAVQHKACIIVPNPVLTGGHQLKNADYLAEKHAAVVVHESELATGLYDAVHELLRDDAKRQTLGSQLATFAVPDAAKQLAMVLLEQAKKPK